MVPACKPAKGPTTLLPVTSVFITLRLRIALDEPVEWNNPTRVALERLM
jgi:hypothetical protein